MFDRYAAIDIGTNSIRLILCQIISGRMQVIDKQVITTRLGENVSNTGLLSEQAVYRTLNGLKHFVCSIQEFGAQQVFCIATSAVRDAVNRDDFLRLVNDNLGLEVQVVNGKQEAMFSYYGVLAAKHISGNCMIVDIGGGSTEIVFCKAGKFDSRISVDIGAVRLKDKFKYICSADDYIIKHLSDMDSYFKRIGYIEKLIGVGGTTTTLAAIDIGLKEYDRQKVEGYSISIDKIRSIYNRLSSMSCQQRKKVAGLQPERADIILQGILILIRIMEYVDVNNIVISDSDNLEGIIYSKILKKL